MDARFKHISTHRLKELRDEHMGWLTTHCYTDKNFDQHVEDFRSVVREISYRTKLIKREPCEVR